MSRKFHRVKTARAKLADKLAAERRVGSKRANAGEVIAQLGDHLARRRAAGSYRQSDLAGEGARPNNMAPSKYTAPAGSVRVLQQGIDTLVLNIYGTLKEDWIETLAMAKEDAQASPGERALSPLPPFDGTTPLMRSTGRPYYEWVATSPDVDVKIRKPSTASHRPVAVVRVSSEALWRLGRGGRSAALLASIWLQSIFKEAGYRVQVSRADLATDYQGHIPQRADLQHVVKRAAHTEHTIPADGDDETATHWDRANRLTGFSSGRSTNIRASGYDKSREIKVSGKPWFRDLWARSAGYRADLPVWRMEIQCGRGFLGKRGIETVDDLLAQLAALWRYGTAWYSFRQPGVADTNRSRWPVAAWWLALTPWRTEDAGELPKLAVVRPRYDRLVSGFVGYLTSMMAITGIDLPALALDAAIRTATLGGTETAKIEASLAAKHLRYANFTMATG
jgi:hypothetical protein